MKYSWITDPAVGSGGRWVPVGADSTTLFSGGPQALTRQQASSSTLVDLMTNGPLATLDTSLAQYVYTQEGGASSTSSTAEVPSVPGSAGLTAMSPDTLVTIDLVAKDGNGADLLASLQSLGLQNGSSFGSVASGRLELSKVLALTTLPDLAQASLSRYTTHVTASQGLVVTQADKAQHDDVARSTYGVDGSGLKVGVISDSFNTSGNSDTITTDIATGDLPVDTTVLQDFNNGTDEGRAMAQLVHDIAPNASIAFATGDTGQAGFANNIIALANAGAKVITDDLLYYNEPSFQDGVIAQAANRVVAQGVSYFSSAGNEGFKGFEAAFNAGTTPTTFSYGSQTYTAEQFADGQTLLPITLGSNTNIVLQWDQPYASASSNGNGSANDLDLFLCNSAGQVLSQSGRPLVSINNNIGRDPIELIQVSGAQGFHGYLKIGLKSGAAPSDFRIVDVDDSSVGSLGTTSSNINNGTIYGHAAATGVNAVAAADYRDTPYYNHGAPQLESFSSGGATRVWYDTQGNRLSSVDVRQVPAFTAADGGDTTFFYPGEDPDGNGHPNFYGTSAAAPDAAATAALMLQARSTLTPADVRHLLMDSSIDMDNPNTAGQDPGYDVGTGSGFIQADLAVGYASTLTYAIDATHRTMLGSHLNDTFNVTSAGAYSVTGEGGADTVAGTAALLNGGTISDFSSDDTIHVTDASVASLSYSYDPTTGVLTFANGTQPASTIQLATGLGSFGRQTDANGGVDLAIGLPNALTVSITGVSGPSNSVQHVINGTVNTGIQQQGTSTTFAPTSPTTVTVSDAGTVLGSTTVASNGTWSLPTTFTDNGPTHTYSLTATASDTAGDSGTSNVFNYGLDFTPNKPLFGTTTTDSNSNQGYVYGLYDGILSRAPDSGGWEHFLPLLNNGMTLSAAAGEMITSDEWTQHYGAVSQLSDADYVTDLYQAALGRAPDTAGSTHWQQALASGVSRADVAVDFALSAENEQQIAPAFSAGVYAPGDAAANVARLYYGLLDRAPDDSGLSSYASAVRNGTSLQSVAQTFLSSAEYAGAHPTPQSNGNYVQSLYQADLGRSGAGDPGRDGWVNGLDSGQLTRAQVAVGVAASTEATNYQMGRIENGYHLIVTTMSS